MPKIDAAITVCYVAWDTANSVGKTGDAANHTLRVVSDGTEATPAGTPAEVDATNLPGVYKIDLTSTENDGALMILGGKSSTSDIVIQPVSWSNESNIAQIDGSSTIDTLSLSELLTVVLANAYGKVSEAATPLPSIRRITARLATP